MWWAEVWLLTKEGGWSSWAVGEGLWRFLGNWLGSAVSASVLYTSLLLACAFWRCLHSSCLQPKSYKQKSSPPHGSNGWELLSCATRSAVVLIQTRLTGSLFVDSQCISDVFVIWICNLFKNWSEGTSWKGATFHVRWDAVKDGLPDVSTSCFRASPHNPSAASDLSTYSTASLISNEEQFEDYGEGDDVDFTPSSPCPDDETRTNAYSDLGSSVSSRLLLVP